MKKVSFLLPLSLLATLGCQKQDQPSPHLAASFSQPFTVRAEQSARLPTQQDPELTLRVQDVKDSRCPRETVCVTEGWALTELSILDQNGSAQPLTLQLRGLSNGLDSATVQANGRTYTVVLQEVRPYPTLTSKPNETKQVVFTVRRR